MNPAEPYREERPWGEFIKFTQNSPSTVKLIKVLPNQALSLQTHKLRSEFWHVINGSGFVTIGQVKLQAIVGQNFTAPVGTPHRLEAGKDGMTFLEISSGEFDEADIERLDDIYGRVKKD